MATAKNKIANLREHILNVPDLEEEQVKVPGWGVTILVRALTGAERARFMKQVQAKPEPGQSARDVRIDWGRWWADIVILSARDPEDGVLIFEPTDRDALLTKSGKNLEVVADVARRLSGFEDDATATTKSGAEDE